MNRRKSSGASRERQLRKVSVRLFPEDIHAVVAFAQFYEIGTEPKSMVRQILNCSR